MIDVTLKSYDVKRLVPDGRGAELSVSAAKVPDFI